MNYAADGAAESGILQLGEADTRGQELSNLNAPNRSSDSDRACNQTRIRSLCEKNCHLQL